MKRHIPNILTILRLVLCLVMFGALVLAANGAKLKPQTLEQAMTYEAAILVLSQIAAVSFVVAAITDFFDGWLARRWKVVSVFGAIMDPIADKVLVCGAILGLVGLSMPGVLVPGTLILFREFAVSAMREVLAPKGLKLPVTFLAKTKTALQLIALAGFLGLFAWGRSLSNSQATLNQALSVVTVIFWIATLVTLWTGLTYGLAAGKALKRAAVLARPPAPVAPETYPDVELEPVIVVAKKPATRRRNAKPE